MEITKGKWEVYGKLCVLAQNVNATETICQLFDDNDIAKNNAKLIADAGNTYQATNKLPSELAEANKELLDALKIAITHVNEINTYNYFNSLIKKHSHA